MDNFFNQTASPPGGAPRVGTGRIIRSEFASPGAGVRRWSFAARTFSLSSVSLFVAAIAISGPAPADTIPPPSISLTASSAPGAVDTEQGSRVTYAQSTTLTGSLVSQAIAHVDLTPSPYVSVSIDGQGLTTPDLPVASASLLYAVKLVAPSGVPVASVPVQVRYNLLGNTLDGAGGATFWEEGFVQMISQEGSYFDTICSDPTATSCISSQAISGFHQYDRTIPFQPGETVEVEMVAGILLNSSPGSFFDVDIDLDPTFTIDPAFLQQNPGYSLEFSDGVGDSPLPDSVPEPATWAMMLAGFGALGAAMSFARHTRGSFANHRHSEILSQSRRAGLVRLNLSCPFPQAAPFCD